MKENIVTTTTKLVDTTIRYLNNTSDKLIKALDNVEKDLPANKVEAMKEKMLKLAQKHDRAKENILKNKAFYLEQMAIAPLMGKDVATEYVKDTNREFLHSVFDIETKLQKEYIALQEEYGKLQTLKGHKTTPSRKPQKSFPKLNFRGMI